MSDFPGNKLFDFVEDRESTTAAFQKLVNDPNNSHEPLMQMKFTSLNGDRGAGSVNGNWTIHMLGPAWGEHFINPPVPDESVHFESPDALKENRSSTVEGNKTNSDDDDPNGEDTTGFAEDPIEPPVGHEPVEEVHYIMKQDKWEPEDSFPDDDETPPMPDDL